MLTDREMYGDPGIFDDEWLPDLDEALADIPAEYQEMFNQALRQEQAAANLATEPDTLAFLRQRRADFRRGSYIRPDGRPGLLDLDPEALYEQALPELVRQQRGEGDAALARRRLLLKVGALALVIFLAVFLAARGRAERAAVTDRATTAATATAAAAVATGPVPIPALPDIAGADEALQTIGGLGGALTIGRPSALALHYDSGAETIALAIDPSKPTSRGELRYNAAVMASANPVAVWLFGTVLNYAIGIPDSLVRNLQVGDELLLSTDTGAALPFVVAETGTAANYDTGRLLSQDRIGLTLFALPAPAADAVAFVIAQYSPAATATAAPAAPGLGEPFLLAGAELVIANVTSTAVANEDLQVVIAGNIIGPHADMFLLALTVGASQTTALALAPDEAGAWQAVFLLPATASGAPLLAEFQAQPAGAVATVALGPLPDPLDELALTLTATTWDATLAQAVLTFAVTNAGGSALLLPADFIDIQSEQGGDAYSLGWQTVPHLPTFIQPGETLGLTVAFYPTTSSANVQTGADLWAVLLPADQLPGAGDND